VSLIAEPLQYLFFQQALLATVFSLIALSLASPTVVANKESFFSHGISQSMVFGIAAVGGSAVLGLFGAVAAALLAAVSIHAFRKVSWLPRDASIAVVSTGLFSMGIIVANSFPSSSISINDVLYGNILGVSSVEIIVLAGLALVSIALFSTMGSRLLSVSQNSEVAMAQGLNVSLLQIIRLVALAIVIALTVPIVGALLVVAVLVLPALVGFTLSVRLPAALVTSISATVLSGIGALFVSYHLDTPTGPTIVITLITIWLTALTFGKLRSILRPTN
jgi:ABC-type Mn2+/Zn2+ transport system permease subunit